MRLFVSFLFLVALFFSSHSLAGARVPDKGYEKTVEAFSRVVCEASELFQYNRDIIRALSYTNKRVLRAFTLLDGIGEEELVASLRRLVYEEITFQNLQLLEQFVTLEGADSSLAWQYLDKLKKLDYSRGRVMTGFEDIDVLPARDILAYVDRVSAMADPAAWAFKAFLMLPGQDARSIAVASDLLEMTNEQQQWAAEQCCLIKGMDTVQALNIIKMLPSLSKTDAANAKGLFEQDIDPAVASSWMKFYFNEETEQKEWLFFGRSAQEKALFLKGLAAASDYQTWKINDLHSVTDHWGREISAATLEGSSTDFLRRLFGRLDVKVREQYESAFENHLKKGVKGRAIEVLRIATSKARVQAAIDITTMHIYILLSKGSELYDSSFRDILVPVLEERVDKRFNGNLLQFLLEVDPGNNHVSDFIISLAQRGKLAVFFPNDEREQKQVLDLVTASAFQDENSLILFSATFMTLLETIEPKTRTYLIGKMLSAIREENTVFTIQLRVILQYYLQYYSEYVSEVDAIRIQMMMYENGAIPLDIYTRTAFDEWKSDGKLSSLSVFHYDDDGRESYFSNCGYLGSKGYRPRLSPSYNLGALTLAANEAVSTTAQYEKRPGSTLKDLYLLQRNNPLVIDWVKRVNGIEISHSVYIFQGKYNQQELLRQFVKGRHEMFAQRGHSYWRSDQIVKPLSKLVADGEITDEDFRAKQRFMSLGSCGGVRVYSELAKLFHHNVDILATVGTGKAVVNNPYNQFLFETVAGADHSLSWDDVAELSARIFKQGLGEDYLQPGSLPAILHKIMDQKAKEQAEEDNG